MCKFIRFIGESRPHLTKNKVYEVVNFFFIDDLGDEVSPAMCSSNWVDVTYDFKEGSKTRPHLMLKNKRKVK